MTANFAREIEKKSIFKDSVYPSFRISFNIAATF